MHVPAAVLLGIGQVHAFDAGLGAVGVGGRPEVVVVVLGVDALPVVAVVGHVHVGAVVEAAAYLVGEAHGEVDAFPGHGGVDAAIYLGHGVAYDGVVGLVVVVGGAAAVVEEVARLRVRGVVHVVHALAVGAVHAGPFVAVEGEGGLAFAVDEHGAVVAAGGVVPDDVGSAIQLLHLRAEEGGVHAQRPEPAVAVDDVTAQFQLEAVVVDAAHVLQGGREAGDHGYGHVLQQVFGVAVEVFHRTAQPLVEEAEVQADVGVVARLPRQVGVGRGADGSAGLPVVAVGVVYEAHVAVVVGGQGAVHAVGCAQAQVAQPARGALHEAFLQHVPGAGHRPEVAPTVVGAQSRGAVAAVGAGQEVAFVVVIIHLGEDGHHGVSPAVARRGLHAGRGDGVYGAGGEVAAGGFGVVRRVLFGLEARHDAHRVAVGKSLRIGGGGGRYPLLVVAAELAERAVVRRAVEVVGAVIVEVLHHGVVVGEDRAHVQPRQQVQGERLGGHELGGDGVVVPLVVVVQVVVGQAAVLVGPGQSGLVVRGPVESPQQVVRLHEVVGACVAGVVVPRLLHAGKAGVGGQFHEFAHVLRQVQASGDAVEAVHAQASVVLGVGQRGVVVGVLRSAAHAHVVALIHAGAKVGLVPVEVLALAAGVVILQDVDALVGRGAVGGELVAVHVEALVQHVEGGLRGGGSVVALREAVVVEHGVEHVHILLHAGGLVVLRGPRGGESHFGLQRHHGLAYLAALGGDEDDAVGRARAVERRCGGVLQHGDGLDVLGVEGVHDVVGGVELAVHLPGVSRRYGHAVDDVEGLVSGVHRADAAYADGGCRAGLSGVVGELQSGHLTVQRVLEGGGGDALHVARLHQRGRAGVAALLGGAVGYHHHFVEHLGVVAQSGLHEGADVHLGSLHAQVGDDQPAGVGRNAVEGELAVHVGHRAQRGALHLHCRPDDGLVVFFAQHYALHLAHCLLSLCHARSRQEKGEAPQDKLSFHITSYICGLNIISLAVVSILFSSLAHGSETKARYAFWSANIGKKFLSSLFFLEQVAI